MKMMPLYCEKDIDTYTEKMFCRCSCRETDGYSGNLKTSTEENKIFSSVSHSQLITQTTDKRRVTDEESIIGFARISAPYSMEEGQTFFIRYRGHTYISGAPRGGVDKG